MNVVSVSGFLANQFGNKNREYAVSNTSIVKLITFFLIEGYVVNQEIGDAVWVIVKLITFFLTNDLVESV